MRLSERQSLDYLKNNGYKISRQYFYELKKETQEYTKQRLYLIASKEYLDQHVERIETLKSINNEMWDNYRKEKDPSKRIQVLKQIADLQLYLSSYYDSTRYIMEQGVKQQEKEQEQKRKKKRITIQDAKKKNYESRIKSGIVTAIILQQFMQHECYNS